MSPNHINSLYKYHPLLPFASEHHSTSTQSNANMFPTPQRPLFINHNYSFIDDAIGSYSLLQKYKPKKVTKYYISKSINGHHHHNIIKQIFNSQRNANFPPPTSPHLKYDNLSFYKKHSSIFHNSILKDKIEKAESDKDPIKFKIRNLSISESMVRDKSMDHPKYNKSESYIKKFLTHKHNIRIVRKQLLENLSGKIGVGNSCLLNKSSPSRSHQLSTSGIQIDESYRSNIYSLLRKIRRKRVLVLINKSK